MVDVEQTTLMYDLESIFTGGVMDGKRTNFDVRRRNIDDDFSPDTVSASPVESPEARVAYETTRDGYDRSFLAERGLLSSPHSN